MRSVVEREISFAIVPFFCLEETGGTRNFQTLREMHPILSWGRWEGGLSEVLLQGFSFSCGVRCFVGLIASDSKITTGST